MAGEAGPGSGMGGALPLDNLNSLVFSDGEAASPAFYRFALEVDSPADTFLDLCGWG